MLKNALVLTAISIMALLSLFSGSAFAKNADYKFIINSERLRLGMTYWDGRANYEGELAVHLETGYFLFVRCGDRKEGLGQKFMTRRDRNCRNQIASWPSNIVAFAQAQHIKVNLDGAPETCGICQEIPFLMFELPDGVEIVPPSGLLLPNPMPMPDPLRLLPEPTPDPLRLLPEPTPDPLRLLPEPTPDPLLLDEMNIPDGGLPGSGVLGGGMSGVGVGR